MNRFALIMGIVFISMFFVNAEALDSEHDLIFDDLNTINFKNKINNIDIYDIKELCSYDYCDYVDLSNVDSGLDVYTKKYLRTINDEETKRTIEVQGIKITKIKLEK